MVEYYPTLTITTEHEDSLANKTAAYFSPNYVHPRTIDGRSTHLYITHEHAVGEDYIFAYALDPHTRVWVDSSIPWMQGSSSLVDTLHVERRKVNNGARQVNLLVGPYRASVSVPVDLVASINKFHFKNLGNWNESSLDLHYATNGTYAGLLSIDYVNFANDTAEIRAADIRGLGNASDLRNMFRNNTGSSARTIDGHPGFLVEGIKSGITVKPAYAWEYLPTNDTRVLGFGSWDATIPLLNTIHVGSANKS